MTRSIALLASCGVHVAFVWLIWAEPAARAISVTRPVEVELRPYRQVEARRGAPGPGPEKKRQVAVSRRKLSTPVAAAVPIVPSIEGDEPGEDELPSGGGGGGGEGDAGVGEPTRTPPPTPDTSAAVLSLPRVEYPLSAREEGVDGVVRLWVQLDAKGKVISVEVLEDPGAGLGSVARSALLRATFRPATHLGEGISGGFEYRYRFELQ